MKPLDPGTLFDALSARKVQTRVLLDRPMELDPDGGTDYDVHRLSALVGSTAARLAAAGAAPGRYVAVVKRNHWDYILIACAAVRLGAVPALLSDHVPPHGLRTLLERLKPAVLVTTADLLARSLGQGVDLAGCAVTTVTLDAPSPGAMFAPELPPGPVPTPVARHGSEPLIVNHTSGTTGVPKLVVHSTDTLIRRIVAFEARHWPVLASRRGDTVASAIAFCHGRAVPGAASVLWLAPARLAVVSDDTPERAVPFLRANPPTTVEAMPSSFLRWHTAASAGDAAFRDVRLYLSTFDAVHPPTVRTFLDATRRRRPIWTQVWGQTETGPLTFRFFTRRSIAASRGDRPTTRDLGRSVPFRVRLRVVDPDTFAPLPPGRPGLVLARTGTRALGYVDESERFERKVSGAWFNTGDLGLRTRIGRLVLLDREVDMIPGASCMEIEDLLHDRLPGVQEAVVLSSTCGPPLPVLIGADGPIDPDEWGEAVRGLPPLAEPRMLPWDEVPRTGTGKVRRDELRQLLLVGSEGHGTGRWT